MASSDTIPQTNTESFTEFCLQERASRLENNNWSKCELTVRNRYKTDPVFLKDVQIPLSMILNVLCQNTILGTYLDEFNWQQNQDKSLNMNKMGITIFEKQMQYSEADFDSLYEWNDCRFSMEAFNMLDSAVRTMDCIDFSYFRRNVNCLNLNNFFLNELDDGLSQYENLRCLYLGGNAIRALIGKVFPRNLLVLDLFANRICELDDRVRNLPCMLTCLSLARNGLTDDSKLHLLSDRHNLEHLNHLDLSDNDICDVDMTIESIRPLKRLNSLVLQGNPLSVMPNYRKIILSNLRKLIYLDNVTILKIDYNDKEIYEIDKKQIDAALIFNCYRIIGLPKPPERLGVVQTIHLEVSLPLLEILKQPVIKVDSPPDNESQKNKFKKSSDRRKSSESKRNKSTKTSQSAKICKKTVSLYGAPNEYDTGEIERSTSLPYMTNRVPWSKVIEFPAETLVIRSPEDSLMAIRDTFRSNVNVRVVYLKVLAPRHEKKKLQSKKITKTKIDKPVSKSEVQEEVVLQKVTLANFWCALYPINWSDNTIDFYWADHPLANPNAISVDGSLQAINYKQSDKGSNKTSKATMKSSQKNKSNGTNVNITTQKSQLHKVAFPKLFTVQVGFGLRKLK